MKTAIGILFAWFVIVENLQQVPCDVWGVKQSTASASTKMCAEKTVLVHEEYKSKAEAEKLQNILKSVGVPSRVEQKK